MVEAEHLLLAMTGEHGSEARDVLVSAGLDRDGIRAALDREFRQSLAAVGVTLPGGGLPPASRDPGRQVRLAASGKLVLARALKAASGSTRSGPGTCCWACSPRRPAPCPGRWRWPAWTKATWPPGPGRHLTRASCDQRQRSYCSDRPPPVHPPRHHLTTGFATHY